MKKLKTMKTTKKKKNKIKIKKQGLQEIKNLKKENHDFEA